MVGVNGTFTSGVDSVSLSFREKYGFIMISEGNDGISATMQVTPLLLLCRKVLFFFFPEKQQVY